MLQSDICWPLRLVSIKVLIFWDGQKKITKPPPINWLTLHRTNNWWRFCKILWLSQNIWTLQGQAAWVQYKSVWSLLRLSDLYYHNIGNRNKKRILFQKYINPMVWRVTNVVFISMTHTHSTSLTSLAPTNH